MAKPFQKAEPIVAIGGWEERWLGLGLIDCGGQHREPAPMLRDSSIVSMSSEVMGGALVFAGTRVPVETLLDYLKAGESADDFLAGFPTVSREQVVGLLEEIGQRVGWVAR